MGGNVLVFNPGSNSLKFEIIAVDSASAHVVRGRKLLKGVVEPIGEKGKLSLRESGGSNVNEDLAVKDHGDAAQKILSRIDSALRDVHVVGHRVVHGADRYSAPVAVDDEVIRTIEELEDLAPLHNASAVSVIRACRAALGERIPEVAVFDTAFHRTIPDRARLYAIPWALTERYGIQRYGFHGISHNYLMLRYAELSGTPVDRTNIITLHLEGGSSATAIAGGKSVDTSMGFTPLEGLIMGTRSGDIDPALVSFLARKENVDAGEVEKWLNKKSGLLGISGRSQDTRDLVQQQADAERSRLALEMFAYRVRKYVGAYLAAMGRAAAVVFGGGISENTPEVRQRICEGLEWFGLDFDADRNAGVIDREGEITRDGTRLRAFVIPSEEGLMIAHEALRCGRSDSDR